MASQIHPSAIIDSSAELGADVVVGANAVIGAEVEVGDGTEIGSGAQLAGPTRIGRNNKIFPLACIGFDPQDLKFAGERTTLEIGDRNHFRELTTVHRGTGKGGGLTRIGSDNLFMAYSHVAHDCFVGDRTVFANSATLAGHVEIHDDVTISAFSAVHQFTRVGRHAYIGGYTVLTQDALPFSKTVGQKPAVYGLNRIGLERKGLPAASIDRLEKAIRLLVRDGLALGTAIERIRTEIEQDEHVRYLLEFLQASSRGVVRGAPGRRRARGGGGGE